MPKNICSWSTNDAIRKIILTECSIEVVTFQSFCLEASSPPPPHSFEQTLEYQTEMKHNMPTFQNNQLQIY